MGTIMGKNDKDLKEAEEIKKSWQEYTEGLSKKGLAAAKSLSCLRLLATPWTAAYQAPPSMGFSRQEYWSGVPLPSPKKKGLKDPDNHDGVVTHIKSDIL